MSKPSRKANHDLRHVLPHLRFRTGCRADLLHLIMRRKPKMLEFPALRFMQVRRDANQRRLRLRHLLLLLLAHGGHCLLALALARPSVKLGRQRAGKPGGAGGGGPGLRRRAADGIPPRKQDAPGGRPRVGPVAVAGIPPESQIAVLDTPFRRQDFAADRGVAKQRIERLET